jgi:hypothetical protein
MELIQFMQFTQVTEKIKLLFSFFLQSEQIYAIQTNQNLRKSSCKLAHLSNQATKKKTIEVIWAPGHKSQPYLNCKQ